MEIACAPWQSVQRGVAIPAIAWRPTTCRLLAARTVDRLEAGRVRQFLDVLVAVRAGEIPMHRSLIQPAVHMEAGPREGCNGPLEFCRSSRDHVRCQFLGRPGEDVRVPVTIQAIGVFRGPQQRGTQRQKDCNCPDKTCNAGPSPEQGEHDRSLLFPLKNVRRVQCRFPDMRPIPIIVDCIHNSSTFKNQDEFSFPGRIPAPSVEIFCRKNRRCTKGKGCPVLAGKRLPGESPRRIRRRSPSIPHGAIQEGAKPSVKQRPFYPRGKHSTGGT